MHRIVGLDATAASLRLVALQSGFRGFELQEARSAPTGAEGTPSERLKAAVDALGLGADDTVAVALPASQVSCHVFSLPFTDQKRLEQVLPAEVEGVIPFDAAEVVWDHAVLSQANGKSEVLVAVVRREVLRAALQHWKDAGVEPRVVTIAPLALGALAERRLLDTALGGLDVVLPAEGSASPEGAQPAPAAPAEGALPGPALLLHAGPEGANLLLVRGSLRVELARATVLEGASLWEAARSDPAALDRLLAPLLREARVSLRARAQAAPGRLLLAGELALLPGAAERLSAELRVPVSPLTFDAQIRLPEGGPSAPDAALALGLALRAQQPRGHVNFRKGEFSFTKDLSQVRGRLARLAAAAVLLLALWIGLGVARLSALGAEARRYDDALCTATKKFLGTCLTDYRQAVSQMSGGASKAAGIPRVSGAEVLAEVIAHLPEGGLPLLEDLEVTTTSVRLKGVAESFAQVDQIIAGLKTNRCFGQIKQPRVEKQRDSTKVMFSVDFPYTCSGETGGA